ncbi:MAG: DUF3052 domain-containing protein [Actinomycetia bacterium]|nr:DUF3052 domain-containing protein [Actinomycetes bacterium]
MATEGSGSYPFGLRPGQLVQELGWDSDVDEDLRNSVMDAIDADMVEESDEAVDAVLVWWRAEDGDVVDALVDALTDLASDGVVWLLTPKVGRPGHIRQADIAEGAATAGLVLTSTLNVSKDWAAEKMVRTRGQRR